uniref:Beta-microseminoprotein n=1 Tax=Pavo cristatus TaxID=9049 RepID=A0A8C9EHW5_PAVCR
RQAILGNLMLLRTRENSRSDSCPHATFSGSYDMKGEPHEFNSHWKTEDCLECSCSKFGISCCATPVNFDEEKCVSIFNNTACAYEVVEKADHSKTCEVHEWVG